MPLIPGVTFHLPASSSLLCLLTICCGMAYVYLLIQDKIKGDK